MRSLLTRGTILIVVGTVLFLLGRINGGIAILSIFGRWDDQTFSVPDEYANYSKDDVKEELVENGFDQEWIDQYSGSLEEYIITGQINDKSIVLETIETLGGHWNADQAVLALFYSEDPENDQQVSELVATIPCEPRHDSWNLGISGTDQKVVIKCKVEIPAEASWLHKELNGHVRMNVTYPVSVGSNAYQDRSRTMSNPVTFCAISETDHTLLKVYQPPGYDQIDIAIVVLSRMAGALVFLFGSISAILAIGSHLSERFYALAEKFLAFLKK